MFCGESCGARKTRETNSAQFACDWEGRRAGSSESCPFSSSQDSLSWETTWSCLSHKRKTLCLQLQGFVMSKGQASVNGCLLSGLMGLPPLLGELPALTGPPSASCFPTTLLRSSCVCVCVCDSKRQRHPQGYRVMFAKLECFPLPDLFFPVIPQSHTLTHLPPSARTRPSQFW